MKVEVCHSSILEYCTTFPVGARINLLSPSCTVHPVCTPPPPHLIPHSESWPLYWVRANPLTLPAVPAFGEHEAPSEGFPLITLWISSAPLTHGVKLYQ